MTVTSTPRLGLTRWGADSDTQSRADFVQIIDALEAEGAIFSQGAIGDRPGPSKSGLFFVVTDAAGGGTVGALYYSDGATWRRLNQKTIRLSHTFTISGDVAVASGDTAYIPTMFVSLLAGQTATIAGVRHRVHSGTSATFTISHGAPDAGTAVTGLAGVVATTTTTTTNATGANALADGDDVQLVITAVTGSPKNLTVTVFIDVTV